MSWFRVLCGTICVLLSFVFLIANTAILARFGIRSATDAFESIVNSAVAGSVPLALAMMPFLLKATWQPGHWRQAPKRAGWLRRATGEMRPKWKGGRPNMFAVSAISLYVVFVAFNFMGAVGSIALQKTEYVDARTGTMDDAVRNREARIRKVKELEDITGARPPDSVKADIDGAVTHTFWNSTDKCTKTRTRSQSRFCSEVAGWKSELGLAHKAEILRKEIDDLDRKLSTKKAHITSADPQSETLAHYASNIMGAEVTAQQVRFFQPLIWFVMLELACMSFFGLSLLLFRVNHNDLFNDHSAASYPQANILPPQPISLHAEPAPGRTIDVVEGSLSGEDAELQAAIFARFWTDCTKQLPTGLLAATTAYSAYRSFCGRQANRCMPYSFHDFLKRTGAIVHRTSTIGGVLHLSGYVLAEPMGDAW